MIYKLYKNGNISCDIEPEDRIIPSNFDHMIIESYSSDSNVGIKNENKDMFIKPPAFVNIKAPWNI